MEVESSLFRREFEALTSLIRAFCISRPLLSRQILKDHPELLTDHIDELIGSAIEYLRAEGASDAYIEAFERGRATLRVGRLQGIDAAFADRLTSEGFDEFSE